jgi:glycerol-3-phosphate dehydrogenase
VIRDLKTLHEREFDVLVIGGGIVGAYAAWDAALRGLSVALVERADFAAGASANSLKFLHGGLRYLQKLELRSMREAVLERSRWLRNAPHLVHPVAVLVPLTGAGIERPALMRAALWLNDLASADRNRDLPPERHLPPGRSLSPDECLQLAPGLDPAGLLGGVVFHDAQMYSAERLVLEVLKGAVAAGATIANYVECVGAEERSGRAVVTCVERVSGAALEIRARTAVNATGSRVFTSPPATARAAPLCRYSVALNLVLEELPLGSAVAVTAPGPDGRGRRLLAVPWRGRTMVGTAHYPLRGAEPHELDPAPFADRFLEEVQGIFPRAPITRESVLRVHSGFLPLAPGSREEDLRLMRRGRIVEDRSPFLHAVSVKFTTARALAAAAIDRVSWRLSRGAERSVTAEMPLPHAPSGGVPELVATAARQRPDLPADVVEHLVRSYGTAYTELLPARWNEELRVVPGAPVILTQFEYAVRSEMAVRPEDVVDRRTEIGATGADRGGALRLAERSLRGC